MPTIVVGALIAGGATAGAAAILGTGIGAAFLMGFTSTLILGGISKALAKKPQQAEFGQQGQMVTVRQAIPPRQVIFGERRVAGALTFLHFGRSTSSASWTESVVIPASLQITVTKASAWKSTVFVRDRGNFDDVFGYQDNEFTEVPSSPGPGEYSVAAGVYSFNVVSQNQFMEIRYEYASPSETTDRVHMVITLAGHRCAAIQRVYFDDKLVTLNANGNATGKFAGFARIKKSLGDEGTAQPFPDLVSESGGLWSSAGHLQAGCTKLYVRLSHNPDLFPNGVPNVTAEVRGALVLDPRTDATGWSNNAALALSNYLTSTDYGLGADMAMEIHDDDHVSAANSCDEAVPLAEATATFTANASTDGIVLATGSRAILNGAGVRVSSTGTLPAGLSAGTTYYAIRGAAFYQLATSLANARAGAAIDITSAGSGIHTLTWWDEPRYTVNGAFLTSEKPVEIIQRLVSAMAGSAVNLGDRWHINAGVYHAPTVTLDEDDLAGPSLIQAHVPSREDGNGVKGVFSNPDALWQPDDFPPIQSSTYVAEDGGEERSRDIDLSAFVTSVSQAQRLAKIDLLRMRQALTESATFKIPAWAAVAGRTVARTDAQLGWSAKPFEIQSSELEVVEIDEGNTTLAVRQTLRETAAAVYDWSTSEEQALDIAPNTILPLGGDVGPPGNPVIVEELYETRDGRGIGTKAVVSWGASSYPYGVSYQLEYRLTGAPEYTLLPPTSGTTQEILDLAAGRYDFRVKATGLIGASSIYATTLDHEILGLGAPPATPVITGLQIAGGLGIITVEPHPDLDVRRGGRWRIRHVQLDATVAWDTAFSIGDPDSWLGDQTILVVPLKPGTYLIRAEDAVGVQSTAYAQIETKQASVLTFATLSTLQEDNSFPGTHSGTAATGGILTLGGIGIFDDIADLDAVTDLDGFGGIATLGTYTFSAGYDKGSVGHLRLTSRIVGLTVNLNDLVDERTGNVDDWLDFDGTAEIGGGSCDAWAEFRETDDDPGGSPVWSDWKRLDASEVEARGIQCRAKLSTLDAAYRPEVSELRVKIEELA
jgi:hypothetical protein